VALPGVVGAAAAPVVRAAASRFDAAGRVEALVDATRFETMHGEWLREQGVGSDLRATLTAMAVEYGLA
jgi:hypothetical protein